MFISVDGCSSLRTLYRPDYPQEQVHVLQICFLGTFCLAEMEES